MKPSCCTQEMQIEPGLVQAYNKQNNFSLAMPNIEPNIQNEHKYRLSNTKVICLDI